jgi:hypothetical protein
MLQAADANEESVCFVLCQNLSTLSPDLARECKIMAYMPGAGFKVCGAVGAVLNARADADEFEC